jgi:hypothetical protein
VHASVCGGISRGLFGRNIGREPQPSFFEGWDSTAVSGFGFPRMTSAYRRKATEAQVEPFSCPYSNTKPWFTLFESRKLPVICPVALLSLADVPWPLPVPAPGILNSLKVPLAART